jgi:hypothetical protein
MGMDAYLMADNHEELYAVMDKEPRQRYNLSRTFYHFMCRQHVSEGTPELDQIGELTSVDIQPLYQMETYPDEMSLEWALEQAESEKERQGILQEAEKAKANLTGNIDLVLATLKELMSKLATLDNLPSLLDHGRRDTLDSPRYFADFVREAGEGEIDYLDNNFGQDLRVIKRFLEFAKSHGSSTVYFEYA